MIGPPLPYNVHADMYTVFRNIRPPPLDQFDLRDMTAREAEICEKETSLGSDAGDNRSREHTVVFIPQSSQIRETMGIIEM